MNSKLLVFNWKMNPVGLKEALALAKASDRKNIVIAAPFVFLEKGGAMLKNAKLGAQDLFWEEQGAFTGEVSAKQIKDSGASYVVIGHSERRHKFGETDEETAKKVEVAVRNKLMPILCVGETRQERGSGQKEDVLRRQLEIGLSLLFKDSQTSMKRLLIAYEPVWAIGTGNPESPESSLETTLFIKSLIRSRFGVSSAVLYGGSVNSQNLKNYIDYKEIDGALVGGASLKKEEIKKMVSIIN